MSDSLFLDLEFFVTEGGSKLLTSGWWGRSRHPNYLWVYRHDMWHYTNVCTVVTSSWRLATQWLLALRHL
jgi:steroid 5-alpha reductase family enzyme